MKTLNKFSIIIGLSFFVIGFSNAGNHHSYIDTAKVIKSKPIYKTIKVAIPEKHCRSRRHKHNHYDYSKFSDNYTPTVRGAITGELVANNLESHSRRSVCKTVMRYESHQKIIAYRVKYRYKGQKFWTRTSYKPASTIRIKVSIKPVAEYDYSANIGYNREVYNG